MKIAEVDEMDSCGRSVTRAGQRGVEERAIVSRMWVISPDRPAQPALLI